MSGIVAPLPLWMRLLAPCSMTRSVGCLTLLCFEVNREAVCSQLYLELK